MNWSARRGVGLVLIGMSTVLIKYVVNQKLKHFDDIIFKELFGRIREGFIYIIRFVPPLTLKEHDTSLPDNEILWSVIA